MAYQARRRLLPSERPGFTPRVGPAVPAPRRRRAAPARALAELTRIERARRLMPLSRYIVEHVGLGVQMLGLCAVSRDDFLLAVLLHLIEGVPLRETTK